MFKCGGKTPRKNFGRIPKRKCVCKIPHPPKVELELGEETTTTTTSHFAIPNQMIQQSMSFKFPCTSMNPRPIMEFFDFFLRALSKWSKLVLCFLTSNAQGSEPIHLMFENRLTRSPFTRLIPVSCVLEKLGENLPTLNLA
jgi:hypothetical protein